MATECNQHGRCPHEASIQVLSERDRDVMNAITRIEKKLEEVAAGVADIKVLENDHAYQKEALSRAFTEIAALKAKLEVTEKTLDSIINKGEGAVLAARILWAVGGAVGALALMQAKYLFYVLAQMGAGQ